MSEHETNTTAPAIGPPAATPDPTSVSDFEYEVALDSIARAVMPAGSAGGMDLDGICRAVRAVVAERDELRRATAGTNLGGRDDG